MPDCHCDIKGNNITTKVSGPHLVPGMAQQRARLSGPVKVAKVNKRELTLSSWSR